MELQDENVKFLKFKIEKLTSKVTQQELHFTEVNRSKIVQIDSLETKVQALEKEVKTHKEKAEEWKAQLGLSREEVERISLDKAELLLRFQDYRAKNAKNESELREQKCESEANARNTLEELKAHYESEIGRVQEGHDERLVEEKEACQRLTESLRIAKEWSGKQAEELEELRAKLAQVKTEYNDGLEDLRSQMEERDKDIAEKEIQKKDMRRIELVTQQGLETNIEKLKKTISGLKNKEDLSGKVSALESTIQDRENVIRKKNLEMARLMKDNKQLQQDWEKEKDNNAVQNIKLDEVQDNFNDVKKDLRAAQSELKETGDRLNKMLRENADLGETNSNLKHKVRRCEPDLIQEREKNRNLTTYVMRFKADLQACTDSISEPKIFVRKVLDVIRHHMDTESKVPMDGNTEMGLRQAIKVKDQLIESHIRCNQNSSRELKLCKKQLFQREVRSNQDQSSLIRQINDMTLELHHVKKQLTETTVLLKLARRTRLQKVSSWMNKNVLPTNKVSPIDVEEPPSCLPGDNTVHRRADNTSSSQPRPHPEDGIIHVKPFVE
ncbi:cilia- and flagella-associated protein 57-like, partial [Etheostoma cragini]|uniref:cilia- and flagella-associated protein 57-like n=1 Tax=Etheostoma cragini TaxID=417921 RepID=UPI00155F47B9